MTNLHTRGLSRTVSLLILVAAVALPVEGPMAFAQVCSKTWTGATADDGYPGWGKWTTAGNWNPAGPPSTTDAVCIGLGRASLPAGTFTIGEFNLSGGTLSGPGHLTTSGAVNWSGGQMTGAGAITRANGGLNISGANRKDLVNRSVINGAGSSGSWTGVGTLRAGGGSTLLNEGGALFIDGADGSSHTFEWPGFTDPANFRNAGAYLMAGGTTTVRGVPFDNLSDGLFLGYGTVVASDCRSSTDCGFMNAGWVQPGVDQPGGLSISGTYTQTATGVLSIKIGGPTPQLEHDQLNVSGAVKLDGTLYVSLMDPFVPTPGDTFVVLTFGSRSGDFATGPEPAFSRTYGPTSLTLTATGSALSGSAGSATTRIPSIHR